MKSLWIKFTDGRAHLRTVEDETEIELDPISMMLNVKEIDEMGIKVYSFSHVVRAAIFEHGDDPGTDYF